MSAQELAEAVVLGDLTLALCLVGPGPRRGDRGPRWCRLDPWEQGWTGPGHVLAFAIVAAVAAVTVLA